MTQYVLAGNLGPALDIAPDQDCVRVPIEKKGADLAMMPVRGSPGADFRVWHL
jgi:hypothetical protein